MRTTPINGKIENDLRAPKKLLETTTCPPNGERVLTRDLIRLGHRVTHIPAVLKGFTPACVATELTYLLRTILFLEMVSSWADAIRASRWPIVS
jgi:hypothetical protein